MSSKEFKYTWCDYLTKCPIKEDIEIGSYDCCHCEHFLNIECNDINEQDIKCSYSKYFKINKGIVYCDHD